MRGGNFAAGGGAQGKAEMGPRQFRGLQSNVSHGGGKGLLFAGRRGRLVSDLAGREVALLAFRPLLIVFKEIKVTHR